MVTLALYLLSCLAAACGFITQMLVSGFWSTTFGRDIYFFSIDTAFYLLSLGLGALLSRRVKRPTLSHVILLTFLTALATSASILLLKLGIEKLGSLTLLPISISFLAGLFVGPIIPFALRVREGQVKLNLLLFLTYSGSVFFTLVFIWFTLVPLGYSNTSLLVGSMVAIATFFISYLSRDSFKLTLAALPSIGLIILSSHKLLHTSVDLREPASESSRVIFQKQTPVQKIVLTEERGQNPLFPGLPQHVLYLDGFQQFSSSSEQNFHACLVDVPSRIAESLGNQVADALVLGGGDGLPARNLLVLPHIKKITEVEKDPEVINLARNKLEVRMYNLDSLRKPKVEIQVADAFTWVRNAPKETYDFVVVDFPTPKNIALSRFYSAEFYSEVLRLLKPNGLMSLVAGPSFSLEDSTDSTLSTVTTCIKQTLSSLGLRPAVYVNPNDKSAFVLVAKDQNTDLTAAFKSIGMYKSKKSNRLLCEHSTEWKEPKVQINTLNTLRLSGYTLDWFERIGGNFFFYRDNHAVFLRD